MSQESFHESSQESHGSAHLSEQEIFSIRSKAQVELMQKYGATDKNYALWRDQHYSEDYAVAFELVKHDAPEIFSEFQEHKDIVILELQKMLDRVHYLRESIEERFIQEVSGGYQAGTKEARDTWLQQYGSLYNDVFNQYIQTYIEHNNAELPPLSLAGDEIKFELDALIKKYSNKNLV